jgi:anti-sigma regulatory factor (Ser/Thr protein kinase)
MSGQTATLVVVNRQLKWGEVKRWLFAWSARHELDASVAYKLDLVLSELLANVIQHAYCDAAEHAIRLALTAHPATLTLEIIDDGRAFDPLAAPLMPLCADLDQAPVGGRGLRLVRQMIRGGEYARSNDQNRLRVSLSRDA